ncbi:MAG TPA: GTPase ObgE [Planctomycetes bacterium]|nr:GTPase ObgE [Planctomycetota bacterium]
MLRDEVEITVRSGNGGDGMVSFLREKFRPEGGPDGGDGGRGGDVILVANPHMNTLGHLVRRPRWRAEDGIKGGYKNSFGKSGEDLIVQVPCGTVVRIIETQEIIADLTTAEQRVVIAAGGRGGKGNVHFKSSINQTPRQFTPGEMGQELHLKLELKLIADVGIVGFPNAGKSTLLSRLSMARPKIAPYPFTTLEPQLGVIERPDRTLVLADIPGLIEGAADGKGLGHQFLRHVERCALLLHLVDGSEGEAEDLAAKVRVLNAELQRFSPELAAKTQIVVLNKLDTRPDLPELAPVVAKLLGCEVRCISGVAGMGVTELENHLLLVVPPRA